MSIKFIPFYFPQFHEIPENNLWWGEGFNDWKWVKQAKPLFKDHYQPRIPQQGYYDLSRPDIIKSQIELAAEYNIHGFNFYHYWFDGKLLLEKPLDNFLQENNQLTFCVTWANETWTKRWVGKVNDVLIEQKHTVDESIWNKHIDYLEKLFTNKFYIRINDEPVFLIYRPDLIVNLEQMVEFYNKRIQKSLGSKIHWIGLKAYESLNNEWENYFDGILRFEPRYTMNNLNKSKTFKSIDRILRSLPERLQIPIGEVKAKFNNSYKVYDYRKICEAIIERNKQSAQLSDKNYQSGFVGWDNTPRYGKRARIFTNATPENFKYLIKSIVEIETKRGHEHIFINAWNEWSESAYLEPDAVYGDAYLRVLKEIIAG